MRLSACPMKTAAGIALLLGLGLFAALTLYEGAGDVARAIGLVGFGVLWIAAIRLAQTVLAGFAWRALLPRPRPRPWLFCKLRWVRESINNLLPVAQIGGDVFGARLLRNHGVPGGLAAASVIVDLLAQTATQVVFTLIGVFFLCRRGVSADLTFAILAGLVIMAPALAGFWLAPRLLAMGWLDRLAAVRRTAHRLGLGGRLAGLARGLRRHLAPALRPDRCRSPSTWASGSSARWKSGWRSILLGEPRSYRAPLWPSKALAMRSRRRGSSFPAPGACRRAAISRSAPLSA